MKTYTLGNGSLLVGLDEYGQVSDFYYPFIGLENHSGRLHEHKIGVFADGSMSWLDDGSWQIDTSPQRDTMSSSITARHAGKNLELVFEDVVYNEKTIFIRKIRVKNLNATKRQIKLYINHQFVIYESWRGDTAYYDPERRALIHYKGRRVFMMCADYDKLGIDDYSIGLNGIEGREGTYKDAEDGILSQNPIEHGNVDSTAGFTFDIKGNDEATLYYWICVAKTVEEARKLNMYVLERTPQYLIDTTVDYWKAWVDQQNFEFQNLDEAIIKLFKQSLLVIRSHIDDQGAIIASSDSDLLKHGRDYYNYMWPRDGAFTASALIKAGYPHVIRSFFDFCVRGITTEGYLMHKYRPDGALGASWHPWVWNGEKQLPIQEDETALVLCALWDYYMKSKDLEYIESIYNSLVKKAAEWMIRYIDPDTGLPMPSYDLWEQQYATFTFTSATVYAALIAASKFAGLLGKSQSELKYRTYAEKIKKAIEEHLYDPEFGYCYKSISKEGQMIVPDKTPDISSFYALYQFGIMDATDERLKKMADIMKEKLWCKTDIGGLARFEGDEYFRVSRELPGNPWIITTLWLAQFYIRTAASKDDLNKAVEILKWVVARASVSGILSEQMNPYTGEQLSASPLTWSHGEFVTTVLMYTEKYEALHVEKSFTPLT